MPLVPLIVSNGLMDTLVNVSVDIFLAICTLITTVIVVGGIIIYKLD